MEVVHHLTPVEAVEAAVAAEGTAMAAVPEDSVGLGPVPEATGAMARGRALVKAATVELQRWAVKEAGVAVAAEQVVTSISLRIPSSSYN